MIQNYNSFLSDYDIHLFLEGRHNKIYEKLGAHIVNFDSKNGTYFSVWAPNAKSVSVVGNFNNWDKTKNKMSLRTNTGIWETFIEDIAENELYKFSIDQLDGTESLKSDPYAFFSQHRPDTASIVYNLEGYEWNDSLWMEARKEKKSATSAMSIYEVHLGTWASSATSEHRPLSYTQHADKLVNYVKEMGYTHIEILPLSEHPFDGSWGYQVTGYYSITSRYGTPKEFMYFVDICHQNGIGVILDWVPAHFPKDAHGLARFDGTALYEHEHPLLGEHPEWGTYVFNHGRKEVKNFLISNAYFLFQIFHIDGIRVDAVSSMLYLDYARKPGKWLPNKWGGRENLDTIEFLRHLNITIHESFKGVLTIAEEATSYPMVSKPVYLGGLGFDYKWNMGWMNDYLKYVSLDPIYRKYNHNFLTFSMMYNYNENYILVLSHDEVVHGKKSMLDKMPGDYDMKFAGLRVTYGFMFGHPGKKLMFMGNEIGQFIEWNDSKSLDWHLLGYEKHSKIQKYVKDLNLLYQSHSSLYEEDYVEHGFEWLDCNDADRSIVSFIRRSKDSEDELIFICNFTPVVYENYRVGVPYNCEYMELLNSDSDLYGGTNIGNMGKVTSINEPLHGKDYSINVVIPPLSTLVLKPTYCLPTIEGDNLASDESELAE